MVGGLLWALLFSHSRQKGAIYTTRTHEQPKMTTLVSIRRMPAV